MNVALTRAKYSLIVIGNSETLCTNDVWNHYIQFMAKSHNFYVNILDSVNSK